MYDMYALVYLYLKQVCGIFLRLSMSPDLLLSWWAFVAKHAVILFQTWPQKSSWEFANPYPYNITMSKLNSFACGVNAMFDAVLCLTPAGHHIPRLF